MADQFGALTVDPVPAPTGSEAISDPALDVLGDYLKAVLNAKLDTAWAAVAPGDGDPVKLVRRHQPREHDFAEHELPALFLWRNDVTPEVLADEWECQRSEIVIAWVFRLAHQSKASARDPVLNGVTKVIDWAIRQDRNPAYVKTGDADPTAATRGSVIKTVADLVQMRPGRFELTTITLEYHAKSAETYPAVVGSVSVLERLTRDPSAYAGGATAAELHADFIVSDATNGDWTIQDTTQDS